MLPLLASSGNTSWTTEQGWVTVPAGRYAIYAQIPGTGTITLQWRRATGHRATSVTKSGVAVSITADTCEDAFLCPGGEVRANAASVSGGNVSCHLIGVTEHANYA